METNTTKMKSKPTASEISLALLWIKNELKYSDINKKWGYGVKSANALYRIAVCLREAYREGRLVIK